MHQVVMCDWWVREFAIPSFKKVYAHFVANGVHTPVVFKPLTAEADSVRKLAKLLHMHA